MKQENLKIHELPMIPVRGMVVYPGMLTHFDVSREKSVKALEEAMKNDQILMISTQIEEEVELPTEGDFHEIGCICKIKQMLKMPGDRIRILVEGLDRAKLVHIVEETPFFKVQVTPLFSEVKPAARVKVKALRRAILSAFKQYVGFTNHLPQEEMGAILSLEDDSSFADAIVSNLNIQTGLRQEFLDLVDVPKRYQKLLDVLEEEIKIHKQLNEINQKFEERINKNQKEYLLKERIKVIRDELGEDNIEEKEVEEFREKLAKLELDDKVRKKISDEIEKYSRTSPSSPESYGSRTYLQTFFDLPWNKYSEDTTDIAETRRILEEDHYGLEDVKERIIEHLAIRQMTKDYKGSIICLVGPPGVGKTSIAKSIARSMNREFTRMSLGGVRDEAEIRGHRRTYVGSIPGRIITAMKEAGTMNPVFLFDEIDKLAKDFNGDPASALLEVFDKNQNNAFVDRYLEVPFDLSKVIFITTANTLGSVPAPLRDRMEIIEVSSYTSYEKMEIAKKYLVKKQMEEHGLKSSMIKFSDKVLQNIIRNYTRESGVRNLEREIGKVCRKVVCEIVEGKVKKVSVSDRNITKYLGQPRKLDDVLASTDQVGVVNGLAWTQVGGETLTIETLVLDGNGKIQLTGKMGEVMKESAAAAISYVRKRSVELGIDPDFYRKTDVHIHIPEGAVPKDGPSAGITMTTALASALSGIPVRRTVAMTGELTITGRVLQIGGLKEKVLAAVRLGIKTVILPESNMKDLEKIPQEILDELEFKPVKHMDEVIDIAFVRKPKKLTKKQITDLKTKGTLSENKK
ncbi:MAG: endopeptidase La [Bacillota bacterium]|nr:endopeptidase La [Bacillota bacterium]